jgi:hypothetical protein
MMVLFAAERSAVLSVSPLFFACEDYSICVLLARVERRTLSSAVLRRRRETTTSYTSRSNNANHATASLSGNCQRSLSWTEQDSESYYSC